MSNKNSHRQNAAVRIYDEIDPYDLPLEDGPEPIDPEGEAAQARFVLDALLRAHRWQLVNEARCRLGGRRADAEDIVQELCVEALEGLIALSDDPSAAMDDLLREIRSRCGRGG